MKLLLSFLFIYFLTKNCWVYLNGRLNIKPKVENIFIPHDNFFPSSLNFFALFIPFSPFLHKLGNGFKKLVMPNLHLKACVVWQILGLAKNRFVSIVLEVGDSF